MADLSMIREFPDTCDAAVSRRGEDQPCEKPAVAAVRVDDEGGPAWAVCAFHALRMSKGLVPLRELLGLGVRPGVPGDQA